MMRAMAVLQSVLLFLLLATDAMGSTEPSCKATVDVGFILDSSGSLRNEYQKEKDFLKALAGAFGISEDGSRASVVTFSYNSELSIKFKDHFDQASFDGAVDAIPLMGSTTRIDKAFRLTQSEMFKPENGARVHLPKIVILLTDGSQTQDADAEDPGDISDEMRAAGITIIVIGVGSGTNQKELDNMAGGKDNAFSAASFDDLVAGDFLKQLTHKSCEVAAPSCKAKADVGFILDSSGSLKADYQKEKDFLKALAGAFGIGEDDSRASVITFSYYSELSIKFKDHFDQASFDKAVDAIPLMDSTTRIDTAFRLTQSEMFKPENGARTHLPKILILLTDGSQTFDAGAEDPGDISDEMRAAGISIIVIGVGSGTNQTELDHMAGGRDNAFSAASFDDLLAGDFIKQLKDKSCEVAKTPSCKAKADVGFILDSSGSLKADYQKEKDFLKALAGAFGIGEDDSRASVITFSYYSELSIKFKDHFDQASFDRAVDAIPLMDSTTRIDKAFRLTQSEMFKPENGARPHLPKILILLTDGSQTKDADAEDPGHISDEMRAAGISIIVIGVGSGTDKNELDHMAGGKDKAFSAASFDELIGGDFVSQLKSKSCEEAQKPPKPSCKAKVDVGFILDSSGSLSNDYQKEKDFLKTLAAAFSVSKDDSRVGVVTFSHNSELSIKLKDHTDIKSFNDAVDAIPLMGSITRIDKALRQAQGELYTPENGGRPGLPKVLILLTDGSQTAGGDAEDPGVIAAEIRNSGISLIVVGIGSGINPTELSRIAGGNDNTFLASSFDELIGGDFIKELTETSCQEAEKKPEPKCKEAVDVGFILDSSGSLRNDYHREKVFLQELAGAFGISKDGSRASVLTFSYYSELSIKFKDYFDQDAFNDAVDAIPLMGYTTRIDTAFRLAQSEMFKLENGARPNLPKILILLTDGSQTRGRGAEDPGDISDELRASGITIIVVGIGSGTDKQELDDMAGGKDKAFSAASFDELLDGDFIEKLTYKSCEAGKKPSPADDWTLLQNHVCFGAKGDAYGSFKTTRSGDLSGLKFVHESGYISCVAGDSRNSNWGCDGYGVGVVVTDMKNNHILTKNERSLLASKSSQDPSLILNVFLKVKKDEELRIWQKEDLKNRGEWNNHGSVCATVYGKFKA